MIPTPLKHGQLISPIALPQNWLGVFFFFSPPIHVLSEALIIPFIKGSQSQNRI